MAEALFTVPVSHTRHSSRRHLLRPNMAFACGRTMLDDDCRDDPWVLALPDLCWVTCAECLEWAR